MRLSPSLQPLALAAALILPLAGCAEQQADLGARIQDQVRTEMAKAAEKLASAKQISMRRRDCVSTVVPDPEA